MILCSQTSLLIKRDCAVCMYDVCTPHVFIKLHMNSRNPALSSSSRSSQRPAIWHPSCPTRGSHMILTANAVCSDATKRGHLAQEAWTFNARSLDILRKDRVPGVDYRESVSPLAGICQIAKHMQYFLPEATSDSRTITAWTACGHRQHGACTIHLRSYKGGSFPYACKITVRLCMYEVYMLRIKLHITEAQSVRRHPSHSMPDSH